MSDKLKNILSQTECPETEAFYNYLDKKLSKKEIHAFESHLNDCEFCQVASEGFSTTGKAIVISSVDEINTKIDKRVKGKFSIQYITAAASIMIALFFGSIYFMNDVAKHEEISVVTELSDKSLNEDKLAPKEVESSFERLEQKKQVVEEQLEEITIVEDIINDQPTPIVEQTEKEEILFDKDVEVEEEIAEVTVELDYSNNVAGSTIRDDAINESAASVSYSSPTPSTINETLLNKSILATKPVDYTKLLAFANQQISGNEEEEGLKEENKKAKMNAYDGEPSAYGSNNKKVILDLLDEVEGENTQVLLDKIRFQQMKDVWTTDEFYTLKWIEIVSMLKLNISAKEELKNLKKNKNPYQKEAKKLYNELH